MRFQHRAALKQRLNFDRVDSGRGPHYNQKQCPAILKQYMGLFLSQHLLSIDLNKMSVCLCLQAVTPRLVLPHTPGRVLRVRTEPLQHYCTSISKSEKVKLDYEQQNNNAYTMQQVTKMISRTTKFMPQNAQQCRKCSHTFQKEFT